MASYRKTISAQMIAVQQLYEHELVENFIWCYLDWIYKMAGIWSESLN